MENVLHASRERKYGQSLGNDKSIIGIDWRLLDVIRICWKSCIYKTWGGPRSIVFRNELGALRTQQRFLGFHSSLNSTRNIVFSICLMFFRRLPGLTVEPPSRPQNPPVFHGIPRSRWGGRRLRGINRRRRPPIGKSVSVSFRVRVVRASERARRSCVGAWEGSVCQRWGSEWGEVWLRRVLRFFVFCRLFAWVLSVFHRLRCYLCGFFGSFVFLMLCAWVFWWFQQAGHH